MSTIKVNDILEATSGGTKFALVRVYATATGAAVLLENSGCSSLTDAGVGKYLYSFSNAMSSSNYYSCGVSTYGGATHQRYLAGNYSGGNLDELRTTTQVATGAYPEGAYADRENGIMVIGSST